MTDENKTALDISVHKTTRFGCWSVFILIIVAYCAIYPLLGWARWKIQNIDSYKIGVHEFAPPAQAFATVTVRDGKVIAVEGYFMERDMKPITIDEMFRRVPGCLIRTPILCVVTFDLKYGYPKIDPIGFAETKITYFEVLE